ncbi:MAG: chorismate synthase [Campylobacter sp.]|uniref:chorismate synthase n=1 Tax=Campylobacter sp. TaxID=205 RepID=UPI002A75705D|nr:chorismate synthase [Campylobacter sp.]MDY3246144.1 chorismate synthase [Campylobacter sp.]MDY5384246.1 chorismate synthase [Campylobacter sp.]
MNTFGKRFALSSFGESHGVAIGGVIDGMPSNVEINLEFLQNEMSKRKPGGKYATNRKEDDELRILSGVFEENGKLFSTGASIGFVIENTSQHSKDYENIKELFRPGHGDFGYFAKWGIRDYRGGGRASARETAIRVAGGAFAQLLLNHFGIEVKSGVLSVGEIGVGSVGESGVSSGYAELLGAVDFENARNSEIFALLPECEARQKELIKSCKDSGESVGASVLSVAKGLFAGLGEPMYDKLDSKIAEAMMSINGVKAVEIGAGVAASKLRGSENNDELLPAGRGSKNNDEFLAAGKGEFGAMRAEFGSNNAGGVLAGISSGADLVVLSHFKPTPSIFSEQRTINKRGEAVKFALVGRHDPCIGVRGSVVATAMMRLVLADMLLLGASSRLEMLKRAWSFA